MAIRVPAATMAIRDPAATMAIRDPAVTMAIRDPAAIRSILAPEIRPRLIIPSRVTVTDTATVTGIATSIATSMNTITVPLRHLVRICRHLAPIIVRHRHVPGVRQPPGAPSIQCLE